MARQTRRNFDDWINIISDGVKIAAGSVFLVLTLIAAASNGSLTFGSKDDRKR